MSLNIHIFSSYKEICYPDRILAYLPCQTSMMKLFCETSTIFGGAYHIEPVYRFALQINELVSI